LCFDVVNVDANGTSCEDGRHKRLKTTLDCLESRVVFSKAKLLTDAPCHHGWIMVELLGVKGDDILDLPSRGRRRFLGVYSRIDKRVVGLLVRKPGGGSFGGAVGSSAWHSEFHHLQQVYTFQDERQCCQKAKHCVRLGRQACNSSAS